MCGAEQKGPRFHYGFLPLSAPDNQLAHLHEKLSYIWFASNCMLRVVYSNISQGLVDVRKLIRFC